MSKKQVKIQIFERLKNEKISQDPDFTVNLIVNHRLSKNQTRFDGYFFFIVKSLKKKFLCVHYRGTYIGQKKIVPVEKNFSPNLPPHKKYVLPTNQSDRCLEDT